MRIALLKPPIGRVLGLEMLTFAEPLGLLCVAGVLEQTGHQCLVVDLRIDGEEHGLKQCLDFTPQLVGLQCNFTTERYRTVELARQVRAALPDAVIVVGGHDASRVPEWFDDSAIDAVVSGDGEDVVPLLTEAVDNGTSLETVPGLMINRGGTCSSTGSVETCSELDALPLPARHLTERYSNDYYINFRRPLALLETSRGCPFKCNFCSVWKFHGSSFREKSPARVVEELKTISAPNVFITDDIFWLNVDRSREIAERIQAAGIRKYFTVQTRTDIICRHPELIEFWKGCGNLAIFLGVEAVTDEGLGAVNKRNTAANNARALEILKELEVGFTSNFLVDPDWDHQDFARLRQWIADHGAYNSGFSVITPLPGTDLWAEVEDKLTTRNWELFDILHAVVPTRLTPEEFYAEYAGLWRTTREVRFKYRSRLWTIISAAAALATGKVTLGAIRNGMNIAKVFSDPQTFLDAHDPATPHR